MIAIARNCTAKGQQRLLLHLFLSVWRSGQRARRGCQSRALALAFVCLLGCKDGRQKGRARGAVLPLRTGRRGCSIGLLLVLR